MGAPNDELRILFLCTGNSCRSQMAEGWVGHLHGGRIRASSAGVRPKGLDPRAVRVMAEVGVDLSGHASRGVEEVLETPFDVVVTVCDSARESCPVFPGRARVVHRGFADPPRLAEGAVSEDEALAIYRRVRDEIRVFVEGLPGSLEADAGPGSTG